MADHEGADARDARVPSELFRSTADQSRPTTPSAIDLAEALGGLDRATRNFTRRLGEGQREVELARIAGEEATREAASRQRPHANPAFGAELGIEAPQASETPQASEIAEASEPAFEQSSRQASFDRRMEEADREAREYLESAKRRADSLVKTMVGAVEFEATQARREAEEGIRARWQQVEVDANRHVENARRVAGQMVAERQSRIALLSDGISGRAEALTAGMDDADRVRTQFEAFIRALAVTADRIAKEPALGTAGQIRGLRSRPLPSAMAA